MTSNPHPLRQIAFALAVAGAMLPAPAMGQQDDMADVQIIAHPVSESVYYLEGRGGNIVITAGEDGVIMIDDQFAPLTDRILAAIRQISDEEIRFVINTHVHGDHTGPKFKPIPLTAVATAFARTLWLGDSSVRPPRPDHHGFVVERVSCVRMHRLET